MKIQLKSKQLLTFVVVLTACLLISVLLFWKIVGTVWTRLDYQALDTLYRMGVKTGHAPAPSRRIVYLIVTDETYRMLGKNTLDREFLANINDVLAEIGSQAVAYDMIFAYLSDHPDADRRFAESLEMLGTVYLPMGFETTDQQRSFKWEEGIGYERLRDTYLKKPIEQGVSRPIYATKAVMSAADFVEAALHSGHVVVKSDPDGVYRHQIMLLRVDSHYIPTLSLAMFLDYVRIDLEDITVDWGHAIRIPAERSRFLHEDVIVPIDEHGRTFIPFTQEWGGDFDAMAAHKLLEHMQEPTLQGTLEEFFSGKFVFIGDASAGIPDLGQTPLSHKNIPLIATHTAMLNGFLTNTFYQRWSFRHAMLIVCILAGILTFAAIPESPWVLYLTGGTIFLGVLGFTWIQFTNFSLFPVVAVGGSFLFVFTGLVVGLQIAIFKEGAYIHNAFARYVPEKVVKELVMHRRKLQLGGEERVVTMLFSDIQGFTTIAERMTPEALVRLLNEYLSEMTEIILAEDGIVDKYEGDAIMAEFGVPLAIEDHADRAVSAALKMQRRLRELRSKWAEQSLPELQCRIGINTGEVIVGNMGSDRVFDYTVIGDAANLASRLEGANKLYNTFLMISEFTHSALTPNRFRTRVLDVIKVKGKSQAVKVFEVYGENSDPVEPEDQEYYQSYQAGFEAYLSRDFTCAREHFDTALQLRPNDPATEWMISRIAELNPEELPDDWDGSVILTSK